MSLADEVHRKIQGVVNEEQTTWHTFLSNHEDYMRALNLTSEHLEVLERSKGRGSIYPDLTETGSKGFLKFSLDGEEFALSVKHVCGAPYGGSWTDCVFAICLTHPSLNSSVGGGTTLISVVPDEWHQRIVSRLAEKEDSPSWMDDDLKKHW